MGAKGGVALKFLQWFIRGVQFCCAGLILAIFSYFLATLHNHQLHIATWVRAVEGISGAAVLYTIIALLLLCCLAGFALTSFLAIVIDVAFVGAFIYVASATRGGAGSCKGYVDTPFGSGSDETHVSDDGNSGFTHLPKLRTACRLETACFAVSIIAIFFFIFSAIVEVLLARHHRREKKYGPSPANNYTSGYGSKRGRTAGGAGGFLGRLTGRRNRNRTGTMATDSALPEHTHPDQVRDSYATETTAVGSTAGRDYNKHGEAGLAPAGLHHNHAAALHQQPPAAGNYQYGDGTFNRSAV